MDITAEMLDYIRRISLHYLPLRLKNWNHADKVTGVREICSILFFTRLWSKAPLITFSHENIRKT